MKRAKRFRNRRYIDHITFKNNNFYLNGKVLEDNMALQAINTWTNLLENVIHNDKATIIQKINRYRDKISIIDLKDEFGWTLLHHAAFHSSIDVIQILIDHGLGASVTTRAMQTPLHIAAISLHFDSIQAFSRRSSITNLTLKDGYGQTPLICLLKTVALSSWQTRISPTKLLASIKLLLGKEINIWSFSKILPNSHSFDFGSHTLLQYILVNTDTLIANGILDIASN